MPALASAKAGPDEPPVVPAQTATLMIGLPTSPIPTTIPRCSPPSPTSASRATARSRTSVRSPASSAPPAPDCSPSAPTHSVSCPHAPAHRPPPVQGEGAKLLDEVAARLDVSPQELTEIVVDDLGLDRDGRMRQTFDGGQWELVVDGEEIITRWNADGRTTKSAPAALRTTHPELVKDARQRTKALRDALAVQRTRLENLLREDREWPVTTWLVRYIEHGLVGTLARRLVCAWPTRTASRPCCGEMVASSAWTAPLWRWPPTMHASGSGIPPARAWATRGTPPGPRSGGDPTALRPGRTPRVRS